MPDKQIAVIGAIDSSGGAGINQDIRVAALLGHQPEVCVSAVTLQDENGVKDIYPVPLSQFQDNLRHILANPELRYIKIGALCHPEQIKALITQLSQARTLKIVLDPVIKPSLGKAFLRAEDIDLMLKLICHADYVCPNRPELELLCSANIGDFNEAISAAKTLNLQTRTSVLVKGGHAASDDIPEALICKDIVYRFSFPRRAWKYDHGTGCAFATAFTCQLARGVAAREAFARASDWVRGFFDELNADHSPKLV